MTITGKSLIAGKWQAAGNATFNAFAAETGQPLSQLFIDATSQEVDSAIAQANDAFHSYSALSAVQRAEFLETIGQEILALGDELIKTACQETGLPQPRLEGERGRTINQLTMFAEILRNGEYQAIIEHAQPQRQPLPKPDTRLGYLPLGVVAVFGASNFPLAFSTAGGDTASALAAGCPVVMKAHTAHPATSELVAQAILTAIDKCQLSAGVFSLIQGENHAISSQIVTHPLIKAVGFTGSERVGMILQQQINQRPEPIPFYGELGSVNPQFILPNKVAEAPAAIAEALVASMMMGVGQFCTSPGIWAVLADENYAAFEHAAKALIVDQMPGALLTPAIADSYQNSVAKWQTLSGVDCIATGDHLPETPKHFATPMLFTTTLAGFAEHNDLQQEVFGPCALIVKCADIEQMLQLTTLLKGNLTASIHASEQDLPQTATIAQQLVHKVGRLIYNQMPTGVEVCHSMNHGGPFPASTNIRSTSVGGEAIKRFQRPICYQNMPLELLPELLKG
ncbi:aldehyde dehydrogenase (NADP(+)) [Colwellia sp. MEBiC06753]